MANVKLTVAELEDADDLDLGVGPWIQIDQGRIDLFADATDDHQWIHVDPARASQGPFGTTVAHGYLTLSLVPWLLEDLLEITDQQRGINYGVDRVRFANVVPSGADVRMRARIRETTRRPDGAVRFVISFELQVRDQERPAAVGDVVYLVYGPSGGVA